MGIKITWKTIAVGGGVAIAVERLVSYCMSKKQEKNDGHGSNQNSSALGGDHNAKALEPRISRRHFDFGGRTAATDYRQRRNRARYNSFGFDEDGYDRDGFNEEGKDRAGYDRFGYKLGVDRAGNNREYYANIIQDLRCQLNDAFQQLEGGKYRYALHDAGEIMEELFELLLGHFFGETALGESLYENMNYCERKRLLNDSTLERLHKARRICNYRRHERKESVHGNVVFVLDQVQCLLELVEYDVVLNQ